MPLSNYLTANLGVVAYSVCKCICHLPSRRTQTVVTFVSPDVECVPQVGDSIADHRGIILCLHIHRFAFDAAVRVEERFGDRRMRVDGEHHLFDGGFEFERGDSFGDDLGRVRADDVDA